MGVEGYGGLNSLHIFNAVDGYVLDVIFGGVYHRGGTEDCVEPDVVANVALLESVPVAQSPVLCSLTIGSNIF